MQGAQWSLRGLGIWITILLLDWHLDVSHISDPAISSSDIQLNTATLQSSAREIYASREDLLSWAEASYHPEAMAAIYEVEMPWHAGETQMHKLLDVPEHENPTSAFLTPFAASLLLRSPLVALGTLDPDGRPWTALWGGEPGFSRAIAQSIIGLRTTVERTWDPVLEALFEGREVVQMQEDGAGKGKMVGGLAIDLENRRRVKLYGRMVAGALEATEEGVGEVQLVVRIEQSLGNCPKYLNKKHIVQHLPKPKLVAEKLPLPQAALDVIAKSDMFFISSSNHEADMDTNIRGGPPGFVRVLSNDDDGLAIVYPEYSGNRLYQTLGNLVESPRAGLVFPDFDTGDVLYLSGTTQILAGKNASSLISHTNLAVKIRVEAVRFVTDGLGFRGFLGERSPYNPPVRYLATEDPLSVSSAPETQAKLVSRDVLSPTVRRFRFQLLGHSSGWKPGQYVALSFQDELDIGYSHMRDDDPKSLNDDFLRTFTVSSRPDDSGEFEITIRKVGPVTEHLFRQNVRTGLEVPVMGFGGEFFIQQSAGQKVAFVAAGVGITPVLAQAQDLELKDLTLYWTVRADDLGLVTDTFSRIPGLAASTRLFVTGRVSDLTGALSSLGAAGATLHSGRMTRDDLASDPSSRWYLCTPVGMRKTLLEWLAGKAVVYEDFNY